MTKIAIDIDCGDKYCQTCPMVSFSFGGCSGFKEKLEYSDGGMFIRCQQCLDAEIKE